MVAVGKGKKRSKSDDQALKDFAIEYAKSSRALCQACEIKIMKDEMRIKKTVFDTEVGKKFGGQALWHHVECFAKVRDELGYFSSGELLPGFEDLEPEDKKLVKNTVKAVKASDIPEPKKIKLEKKEDEEDQKEKLLYKTQNEQIYKYKGLLEANLKKNELSVILEHNNLNVPVGKERILNLLSDILTFGALKPCPECGGQFRFDNKGYICTGSATEWSKCVYTTKEPKRVPTKIPLDIAEDHKFLAKYKCKVQNRHIPYYQQSADSLAVKKEEDTTDGPKVVREKPRLYNMEFLVLGKLSKSRDEIKKIIVKAGGRITTKLHDKVMAVIAPKKMVEEMTDKMEMAQTMNIQVVGEEFLDEFMKVDPIQYIQTQNICDWGSDPRLRICADDPKSKSKSIYEKSVPKSMTLKLKDGSAVDPDSDLQDIAHVYQEKGAKFNCVLALTDIQTGKNSFYKLQLLQADSGNKFWIFRSWGRIGTTIGNKKVEKFSNLYEAKNSFEEQYLDKTGNDWEDRDNFVKRPNRYYPLDIDYGEDDEKVKSLSEHSDIPSKLDTRVQDLVKLIFDINAMKKVMLEFELDMEKMPLGKLSQKQIKLAYGILNELSDLVTKNGSNSKFVDASNRFYTLIPHSFGVSLPPILDTLDAVRNKMNMLETLLEIEVAYSMLSVPSDGKEETNPIDLHYNQLKTDLVPVEKGDAEYEYLMQYVKNTHAETHNQYELDVETIYKVNRSGEAKRYKPFKKLHNRRLLWHGSRLTNYVGILSHGLKIAPPEAPSTGYMFGKGVYFADMVSKSANYCATSSTNPTGLMLLCEVALGDMKECTNAEYVTKLPKDKHSTWGKGKTYPNPEEGLTRDDGVIVPNGKAVSDKKLASSLLYNEFIVYDAAQVQVQYLFKMNFKYKY